MRLQDPQQRAEAMTAPEGAKGWEDQADSAQVLAGGHGLDVAPDAQPEGTRAEACREEAGAGGEPSNSPTAGPSTPLLDKATVARFTVEDFPLEPGEHDALQRDEERYALEDALREVVDFEMVASAAARLWRERRTR